MIDAAHIVGWLAVVLLLPYLVFIGFCALRWKYIPKPHGTPSSSKHTVTVVIVARNEEKAIKKLLRTLAEQGYPKDQFDVIIIDDNSDDKTLETALSLAAQFRLSLKVKGLETPLRFTGSPKKAAIQQAAAMSKSDILLLTDADCILSPGWITSHVLYYEAFPGAKLVFGPFYFEGKKSIHSLLNLEAINLSGVGAVTNLLGMPTMCSGANLSYKRELVEELKPFDDNMQVASGDDEFMLHSVSKKYPDGAFYNKIEEGAVATLPPLSLTAFYFQRRRWAGKWKSYTVPWPKWLSLLVFAGNAGYLFALILFLSTGNIFWFGLMTIKWLVEGIFSLKLCSYLQRMKWLLYFIPMEIIYPFYAIFFGIAANFGKYQWKGRSYS